jgi:hypothetical protein
MKINYLLDNVNDTYNRAIGKTRVEYTVDYNCYKYSNLVLNTSLIPEFSKYNQKLEETVLLNYFIEGESTYNAMVMSAEYSNH